MGSVTGAIVYVIPTIMALTAVYSLVPTVVLLEALVKRALVSVRKAGQGRTVQCLLVLTTATTKASAT